VRTTKNALALTLSVFVLIFCFAGVTNFNSLVLRPAAGDANALDVQSFAGTSILKVDKDGVIAFTAGAKVTFPDTAYFTQLRIGTGSTPDNAAAIAPDGLFVEGAAEIDGALRVDGVLTANAGVGSAAGYSVSVGAAPIATSGLVLPALAADPAAAPAGFVVVYFHSGETKIKAINESGVAVDLCNWP
jgi:hypothetical protein